MLDPARSAEMARLRSTITTAQRHWIAQKALLLLERAPVLLDPNVWFAPHDDNPRLYEVHAMLGDASKVTVTLLEKPGPASGWGTAPSVFEFDAFSEERGNLFNPEDRTCFATKEEGRFVIGLVLHEILRIRGEA